MTSVQPRVVVLYHFLPPDDVVSARHFGEFCADLARHGWAVEARPCNRGCHDASVRYPPREQWEGVKIRRIWRPAFRQARSLGRLLNAVWMLAAWCGMSWSRREQPDVLVIGTDPVLSVLVAWVARRRWPRMRIAHWCFDMYPEGPIADGMLRADGWPARLLRRLLKAAYASCDLVVDLGGCMRRRLEPYGITSRSTTLVPWALEEPAAPEPPAPLTRQALFGTAALGLLYSGNFGRAHSFTEFLGLARRLRGSGVQLCFGVRGHRAEELRRAISPDDGNVTLAGFAAEADLGKRLAAADIHLVSLRPEWTGVVVPSKFFGSLASGRPVIFAGARDSAIAGWIQEHGLGWVLDKQSEAAVAAELQTLASCPRRLAELQRHCHQVYHEHFSRRHVMAAWNRELGALLTEHREPTAGGETQPSLSTRS